jgi:hypothetical protein
MKVQPTTEEAEKELTVREAGFSPKLRDWRAKLSAKAKQEKRYRFYSLYGLVSHPETVREAWAQVRANGGKPGVDGVSIEQIEREGEEAFRLDRDLHGRDRKYWNMHPSKKSLAREREKLRGMIDKKRCFQPLPELIGGGGRKSAVIGLAPLIPWLPSLLYRQFPSFSSFPSSA